MLAAIAIAPSPLKSLAAAVLVADRVPEFAEVQCLKYSIWKKICG
jgi:hypothetical protein